MEFFKRFKRDKKFRNTALMVIIVGLFLLNYTETPQSQIIFPEQSVCGTCGDGFFNLCQGDECINLNCVPYNTAWGVGCKAGLDVGDIVCGHQSWVSDNSMFLDGQFCKAGLVAISREADWTRYTEIPCQLQEDLTYTCITKQVADNTDASKLSCKSWQRSMAKILDGIWKESGIDDCSTKAYLVVGAMIFLAMAVI